MSDLISRQAAIDAIEKNAYRHTYLEQIIDIIKSLPSAQPEIIRCLDCIWYLKDQNCARHMKPFKPDGFCSEAVERRTDEQTD